MSMSGQWRFLFYDKMWLEHYTIYVRNTMYCYLSPGDSCSYYLVRPGYHVKKLSYNLLTQHIHILEAQLETDCLLMLSFPLRLHPTGVDESRWTCSVLPLCSLQKKIYTSCINWQSKSSGPRRP